MGGGRTSCCLNNALEPQATWYGGELVVENKKITPKLDEALSKRYSYPKAAFATVKLPETYTLTPKLPTEPCTANVIRTALPGITLFHEQVALPVRGSWNAHFEAEHLCFVSILERHGKSGEVAHGLLKDFGLTSGAVASSVGHDAHNLIVAGRDEADMRLAVETIRKSRGGVVVVRRGEVLAEVALPIAGLLAEGRAPEVAEATAELKKAWTELGCTLPYMGFNLIPLSVIPEIRYYRQGTGHRTGDGAGTAFYLTQFYCEISNIFRRACYRRRHRTCVLDCILSIWTGSNQITPALQHANNVSGQ